MRKNEFLGAFGDLGTFIPIFIALVAINGLNPVSILIVVGVVYIISGFYFRLPIPVQPLKAVAAIAIAVKIGAPVISAAGILMGFILLVLGLSGLTEYLTRVFSRPIVKGIQLGIGLMLIKTGAMLLSGSLNTPNANLFGIRDLRLALPSLNDFYQAFWLLVLPQLPLTLGNAIVATKDAAVKYFGEDAKKVTERALSLSMAGANILSGFIGGMPICHGSGGLTAHYSFGARSGSATIITGIICLIVAFLFGENASAAFKMVPHFVLSLMLFYVGFKHACLVKDLKQKQEYFVASGIGVVALLTNNLAIAFGLGIAFWHMPLLIKRFLGFNPHLIK